MKKPGSLKLIALLLGWFFIQSAAICHEYSEEHRFASPNHLCLAQAAHLDEIAPNSHVDIFVLISNTYLEIASQFNQVVFHLVFNSNPGRAPPL